MALSILHRPLILPPLPVERLQEEQLQVNTALSIFKNNIFTDVDTAYVAASAFMHVSCAMLKCPAQTNVGLTEWFLRSSDGKETKGFAYTHPLHSLQNEECRQKYPDEVEVFQLVQKKILSMALDLVQRYNSLITTLKSASHDSLLNRRIANTESTDENKTFLYRE